MDAGPIVAQETYDVPKDMQAPELLGNLFSLGTDLLLRILPSVWTGEAEREAVEQDEEAATHAAKLTKEESNLDFSDSALQCHNKVRAFAGWPGTFHTFHVLKDGETNDAAKPMSVKILRTKVGGSDMVSADGQDRTVIYKDGSMVVRCDDGSVLQLLELQIPGKKAVDAKAFNNGLIGKTLMWSQGKETQ